MGQLNRQQYTELLAFRVALRRFFRWSEERAAEAGLTSAQHQLLLAIQGHGDDRGPTVGELADYLLLRHHSAVGLVDRAEVAGLVERRRDEQDGRVTRVTATDRGRQLIGRLSRSHLEELVRLAPLLEHLRQDVQEAAAD